MKFRLLPWPVFIVLLVVGFQVPLMANDPTTVLREATNIPLNFVAELQRRPAPTPRQRISSPVRRVVRFPAPTRLGNSEVKTVRIVNDLNYGFPSRNQIIKLELTSRGSIRSFGAPLSETYLNYDNPMAVLPDPTLRSSSDAELKRLPTSSLNVFDLLPTVALPMAYTITIHLGGWYQPGGTSGPFTCEYDIIRDCSGNYVAKNLDVNVTGHVSGQFLIRLSSFFPDGNLEGSSFCH